MIFDNVLNDKTHEIWEELQWKPSITQFRQLISLQNLLIKWNKKINLTRLTEGNDYWISQILDSLWPIKNKLLNSSQRLNIIDVGTGCGLPGLAIAIALPNASLTLVDSVYKKTFAVKEIAHDLDIQDRVTILTERVELIGQDLQYRGRYDLATARAVASAQVLAEYLIPLLNSNGKAILYKGKWTEKDNKKLIDALVPLKAKVEGKETFQLPERRGIRNIITLVPVDQCPDIYPRAVGIPIKNPL